MELSAEGYWTSGVLSRKDTAVEVSGGSSAEDVASSEHVEGTGTEYSRLSAVAAIRRTLIRYDTRESHGYVGTR